MAFLLTLEGVGEEGEVVAFPLTWVREEQVVVVGVVVVVPSEN